VTHNQDFKVIVYLQVKYLKHGASLGQSYYRIKLSMTLIDPWPGFQGHNIFRH